MTIGFIGKAIGGRYEVKRLLGEGGMAEVYEGHDPKLNRRVAVKLMHRHLSKDEQFRIRFEREAQAIAQLKHPHIIQVYDFEFDRDLEQYYMIIEYLDGPTLSAVIRKAGGLIPLARTLEIIENLADALGYAHAEKMQHRDIKPSNVILDKGTRTVLTDFGIAKLVQDEGQQLTASGAMVGTPAYMSPEQASGMPADARSDIYSLGVVFYQLATGQLPYEGETPIATVLKHLKEPPPMPTQIRPDLPLGVEAAILRCLAKNPTDRYQSCAEMLHHLRDLEFAATEVDKSRLLAGKVLSDDVFVTGITATPTGVTTPYVTPPDSITGTLAVASRQTSMIIAAGAVAIIALLGLGAFLFSTAGSSSTRPDATPDACLLTLAAEVYARPEPNDETVASIRFAVESEIRVIDQAGNYWLIKNTEREGWVSQNMLLVPEECSPG